jgi:ApaG protein
MIKYIAITDNVKVEVRPFFIEQRSNILDQQFFFAYFVTIINNSSDHIRLLKRHWLIHDEEADDYEINGDGVVGEQPVIEVGAYYTYNSFCILKSFEGFMEGSFQMKRADGTSFDVEIPKFFLKAYNN